MCRAFRQYPKEKREWLAVEDATRQKNTAVAVGVVVAVAIDFFMMTKFFQLCSIFLAIIILSACSSYPEKPIPSPDAKKSDRSVHTYTLAEKKLLYIIDQQNRFFERIKSKSRMSRSDALSIKSRIDSLWEEYLATFPTDTNALIINGKFLRATGGPDTAYKRFLEADKINPNIAVVKQQLANYEAEHGMPTDAYQNMKSAIALDGKIAIYYIQLADLLLVYREEFLIRKIFTQEKIDAEMIGAIEQASKLEPKNSKIQWKYARFFYDIGKPDWQKALAQWDNILQNFAPLNIDKQTALANKARVLIELNKDSQAEEILKQIDLKNLSPDIKKLMFIIESAKQKKLKK